MTFHLLHLKGYSIFDQLQLEEALLRLDTRNWCIVNEGSSPAIVMGISGKPLELVDFTKAQKYSLPLIKRFSGGGTVVVDEHTVFVTFICQKEIHAFPAFPEPILKWGEDFFKTCFLHDEFALRENDYVIGEKKCGGNAQYIKKERWLQHTSFLWDFKSEHMNCLLHPKKTPNYREGRKHEEFICCLKDFHPDKETLIGAVKNELAKRFSVEEMTLEAILPIIQEDHRKATVLL